MFMLYNGLQIFYLTWYKNHKHKFIISMNNTLFEIYNL